MSSLHTGGTACPDRAGSCALVYVTSGPPPAAPKCKKFSELSGKINKLGAKDPKKFKLLEPAMNLNQQGKLKFN